MTDKPKYNPAVHHRRSIRLKGYDYSQAGAYFITICTHNRQPVFGEIVDGEMRENDLGQIADNQWQKIPARFENIELDTFVIMPNHIHGIIVIHDPIDPVGAGFTPAPIDRGNREDCPDDQSGFTPTLGDEMTNTGVGAGVGASPTPTLNTLTPTDGLPQRTTIGNVVGAYKSLVTNECLKIYKTKNEFMGKLWQRNYYEHIIRDEKSYMKIAQYIHDNPAQWELDSLYPGGNNDPLRIRN